MDNFFLFLFFSFGSKLWGDLKMYVFHPFAHISMGAKLQRDALTALGGGVRDSPAQTLGATAWNKSQNGGGRDEAGGVRRAKLRVPGHEFKSRFIFFSLCSCMNLSFLIFSKEEGLGGGAQDLKCRAGPREQHSRRCCVCGPAVRAGCLKI